MSACPECGADSATECRAAFERMLAFEWKEPAAFGAVHHLTVATFYLQHPADATHEILDLWRTILADTLDGRTQAADILPYLRRRFDGPARVRQPGAKPPAWWPTTWSMTAVDAQPGDLSFTVDRHVDRVRAWAAATRTALDAAGGPAPR